jgi:hypothetical protein
VGVKGKGNRRQYKRQNAVGHYELLKWRSHAQKYAAWRNQQLKALIDFIICTPAKFEINQKRRQLLASMIEFESFWFRARIWIHIFISRCVLAVSGAIARSVARVRSLFARRDPVPW